MSTVLLDDFRDPEQFGVDKVYRTAKEFDKQDHKDVEHLFVDHDLGLGRNGYDCVVKLIEERGVCPRKVTIVSANPVGVERIGRLLIYNGYAFIGNKTFQHKGAL